MYRIIVLQAVLTLLACNITTLSIAKWRHHHNACAGHRSSQTGGASRRRVIERDWPAARP